MHSNISKLKKQTDTINENKWIHKQSHLKSFLANHANKAGIQLILSLYLQLLNLFLIKKTVQTVSGWRVLLDRSGLPESCLCFIVWGRGELHPWPRTRTAGFLWAKPVPSAGLPLLGTRGDWFHSTLEWVKGKEAGSWNNIPGNWAIGDVW